jgi:beta-lactam-binding protein with PASTA domain
VLVLAIVLLTRGGDEKTRPVPAVVGIPVEQVVTYLEGAGNTVDVTIVPSDAPQGIVIGSEPAEGEPVAVDGTIRLSVSSGPEASSTPTTTAPAPDPAPAGRGDKPAKGHKKGH